VHACGQSYSYSWAAVIIVLLESLPRHCTTLDSRKVCRRSGGSPVSGRDTMACGGSITMVYGAGWSSSHGVVVMGAGSILMLCLWEMGKLELPSPLEAV
jgi:hypothetical protein